jgi:UDP:flavonoid glycosyltransferase YjiC (YdhE family)
VLAVPYAPYDRVFPRASVVVVHGGADSSGEALRSGRPVLGVPFAFDQFTLSEWMQRLGIGLRVATRRRDVTSLVSSLRRLLSDRELAGRATEVGTRLDAERDGAEVAADAVERLAR